MPSLRGAKEVMGAGAAQVRHAFSFQEGSLSGRAIRLLPGYSLITRLFQAVMVGVQNLMRSRQPIEPQAVAPTLPEFEDQEWEAGNTQRWVRSPFVQEITHEEEPAFSALPFTAAAAREHQLDAAEETAELRAATRKKIQRAARLTGRIALMHTRAQEAAKAGAIASSSSQLVVSSSSIQVAPSSALELSGRTQTGALIRGWLTDVAPALHQLQPESCDTLLSTYATLAYPWHAAAAGAGAALGGYWLGREYLGNAHDFMRGLFGLSAGSTHYELLTQRYPNRPQASSALQCVLRAGDRAHDMSYGYMAKLNRWVGGIQGKVAGAVARPALSRETAVSLSESLIRAIGTGTKESLQTVAAGGGTGAQAAATLLATFGEKSDLMNCLEMILKPRLAGCLVDINQALNAKYVRCLVIQPATQTAARVVTEVTLGALIERIGPQEVLNQLRENNPAVFDILEGPVVAFLAGAVRDGLEVIATETHKAVIMSHILTYIDHINRVRDALYDMEGNLSFHQILASKSINPQLAESFTALCSLMTGRDIDSEETRNLENQFRNGFAIYELYKFSSGGVVGALRGSEALTEAARHDGASPEVITFAQGMIGSAQAFWSGPSHPMLNHSMAALNEALAEAGRIAVPARADSALNEALKAGAKGATQVASSNQGAAIAVAALGQAPAMARHAAGMGPALSAFMIQGNSDRILSSLFQFGRAAGVATVSAGAVYAANQAGEYAVHKAIDAGVDALNPDQRVQDVVARGCAFIDAFAEGIRAPYREAPQIEG